MRATNVPDRLYVATTNAGKIRDFASASQGRILLEPLPGIRDIPPPEEDQLTFAGNAALKAIFYSRFAPDEIVLADDSGLEVDALAGAPGVRSARYAEDMHFTQGDSPDQRNNLCLLAALEPVPHQNRQARYRCALATARNGSVLYSAEATTEGVIVLSPQGNNGFGYDPLFVPSSSDRTMAQLTPNERLSVSHRAKALTALLNQMESGPIPAADPKFAQPIR